MRKARIILLVIFLGLIVIGGLSSAVGHYTKKPVDVRRISVPPTATIDPQTRDECVPLELSTQKIYKEAVEAATSTYNSKVAYIPAMVMPGDPYVNGQMLVQSAAAEYNQTVNAAYNNYVATDNTKNCLPLLRATANL